MEHQVGKVTVYNDIGKNQQHITIEKLMSLIKLHIMMSWAASVQNFEL